MEAAPALARRPIKARDFRWAAAAVSFLGCRGVTPDAISLASIVFVAIAALAFLVRLAGQSKQEFLERARAVVTLVEARE